MIAFKDLKPIIAKACSSERTKELSQRLHFQIDFRKLEQELRKNNTRLHVVAGCDKLESSIPKFEDIQLLAEYPRLQKRLSETFLDGKTEIISFMLFSDNDGYLALKDETSGEQISYDDVFEILNGTKPDPNVDYPTLHVILDNFPMNRVVVVKKFNSIKERFDYSFFIRSNYEMIQWVKENNQENQEDEAGFEE